jgi:hypothetical protein
MAELLFKAPLVYEPLRKNRFIFSFPSDTGIQSWWVSTSALPSINQNSTEMAFLNTSTWVLGRYVWEELTITFRQFIGPSTTQALMEWVRLESESATGRQGYAAGYKRNISISMLDPTGVPVQKWVLINAFPTTVNFGDLAYDSDDIAVAEMSLRYDYAINVF